MADENFNIGDIITLQEGGRRTKAQVAEVLNKKSKEELIDHILSEIDEDTKTVDEY